MHRSIRIRARGLLSLCLLATSLAPRWRPRSWRSEPLPAFSLTWDRGVKFDNPADVAAAPDGSVYVADRNNHRIDRFSADGAYLTEWGGMGDGDRQFSNPTGLAVGPDGSVLRRRSRQ